MIIDCAVDQDGKRQPGELALHEAYEAGCADNAFVWIGLYEPDEAEFDSVRREFNLHELAVEDAITAHQRPKLEVYDDTVFVVLRTARYLEADDTVDFGEIMLFIGPQFVVAVRHKPASALGDVRKQVESRPDLLRFGPGAVLYAVLDRVVDDYQPMIDGLDRDIKEVETEVFSHADSNPAERIYLLKREVIEFHQAAAPLAEPLDRLAHGLVPGMHGELGEYFRDIQDHLVRVVETVSGFRGPADQRPGGQPDPGRGAPERGHAQDLGLGGDRGRADHDRRHLRHELRAHAGAHLDLRLPPHPGRHGPGQRGAVPRLPPQRLALSRPDRRLDVADERRG